MRRRGPGRTESLLPSTLPYPLGKAKLLEEQHLSRHGCQGYRPEEWACPLLASLCAWAAHDQTGFLEKKNTLDLSLFKSGDNSFDFFVSLHKEGLCWHVQPLVQGPCWHVQPLAQGPSFMTKDTGPSFQLCIPQNQWHLELQKISSG